MLLLGSCGLISLEVLQVDSTPAASQEIVKAGSELRLGFSAAVDHQSAIAAVHVGSSGQTVSGDYRWDGNTLYFKPVPDLLQGRRYILDISGPIKAEDGRSFTIQRSVDFFCETAALPPQLASFSPLESDASGIATVLAITFDRAMDSASFKNAFSLSPADSFTICWSADATQARVTPQTHWAPGQVYTWRVSAECKAQDGIKLAQAAEHCFTTRADAAVLSVTGAVVSSRSSAAQSGETWTDVGTDLSALRKDDAIRFSFSTPIDRQTLDQAFRITPSMKGHFLLYAPSEALWIPESDWTPQQDYVVSWSTSLKDLAGNALKLAWRQEFTLSLGWLRLDSLEFDRGDASPLLTVATFNDGATVPVYAPREPEKSLRLILHFNHNLSAADRSQFTQAPSCARWFPDLASVFSPALISVSFPAPSQVALVYEGFSVGTAATATAPAVSHLFRFILPGGTGGIRLQTGECLKEDTWLVFATN